jgi:hypothetical protein
VLEGHTERKAGGGRGAGHAGGVALVEHRKGGNISQLHYNATHVLPLGAAFFKRSGGSSKCGAAACGKVIGAAAAAEDYAAVGAWVAVFARRGSEGSRQRRQRDASHARCITGAGEGNANDRQGRLRLWRESKLFKMGDGGVGVPY